MKQFTGLLVILLSCAFAAYGFTGTRTVSTLTSDGEITRTVTGTYSHASLQEPAPLPSQVLWHYSVPSGFTQKVCPIGMSGDYVFTGGWYGGARMFQGVGGSGVVLWMYEPSGSWSSLGTGTAAAQTQDIFYAVQNWDPSDGFILASNTAVHCFNAASVTPVWSYDGTGTFNSTSVDTPGKYACSPDGSVLAVGGAIGGHLAIQFFSSSSPVPIATYEDSTIAYRPRQLRLTEDGSKCIFRITAMLYRVDVATGTLEASYALDASTDCFGVSPDGSVVAYGFTAARVAVWDGSSYNLAAGFPVPGYYAGAATVASDNSTIYFGFYSSSYLTNRIIRYDLSTSSIEWQYDYPTGSGSYQDVVEWIDCSSDGRWSVVGSWGCQTGGGDEVNVFDDLNPGEPVFSINTPGSMFHVDITDDGKYISAAGKHVHANVMGSGTDLYMAEVTQTGTGGTEADEGFWLDIFPNPVRGALTALISIPAPETVTLDIFDLSGRLVSGQLVFFPQAGQHQMQLDPSPGAGVYFCRMVSGEFTATQRFVVIE